MSKGEDWGNCPDCAAKIDDDGDVGYPRTRDRTIWAVVCHACDHCWTMTATSRKECHKEWMEFLAGKREAWPVNESHIRPPQPKRVKREQRR